jgi:predicted TIM-barrel fold metal-dependent hydrolase
MEPLYALAEELDVPIALHMHPGPPGAPYPPFSMMEMRAASGHPLLLEDTLVRHPKLRLYVKHAGWPFRDEMKALYRPSRPSSRPTFLPLNRKTTSSTTTPLASCAGA